MPKKRPSVIDDFADNIVDSIFERGADFFTRMREQQRASIQQLHPPDTLYTCANCFKPFPIDECQMVDPRKYAQDPKTGFPLQGYFGQCVGCWTFAITAAKQKYAYLRQRAGQQPNAPGAPPPPPRQPPKMRPPWEVLGIEPDASVDEIRKAYRKLAAQYHDDRFNGMPNVTAEMRAEARAMFDEFTRCRDAMLKVRGVGPSTGTTG